MYYTQRSNLKAQQVDEELLILNLEQGTIHQLNNTAAFVWSHCDGETDENGLVLLMIESYGIDRETATRDIEVILPELIKLELIDEQDSMSDASDG